LRQTKTHERNAIEEAPDRTTNAAAAAAAATCNLQPLLLQLPHATCHSPRQRLMHRIGKAKKKGIKQKNRGEKFP